MAAAEILVVTLAPKIKLHSNVGTSVTTSRIASPIHYIRVVVTTGSPPIATSPGSVDSTGQVCPIGILNCKFLTKFDYRLVNYYYSNNVVI